MAVYLGSGGLIQLQRAGNGSFFSELDPGDVDVSAKRFSFDFPDGTFVTGDRITLRRLDANGAPSGQPLDFVNASGWEDSQQHSDGAWYVNVDAVGGIRLFKDWADALRGSQADAVLLNRPSGTYRIVAGLTEGTAPRCLGEVLTYELSTNRNAIDVTSLGDAFQQNISGLISGGGSVECFWDWQLNDCNSRGLPNDIELANYLHQLVLRQELGSKFKGLFYLKASGAEPITDKLDAIAARTALFYSVDCVITDVGMAFEPGEPLRSKIGFVTTGEIHLLYTVPYEHLLQESSDKINLETEDGKILLEA